MSMDSCHLWQKDNRTDSRTATPGDKGTIRAADEGLAWLGDDKLHRDYLRGLPKRQRRRQATIV